MKHLARWGEPYLPLLKWVLVIGLISNLPTLLFWWCWTPRLLSPDGWPSSYGCGFEAGLHPMVIIVGIAAFLIDPLPGTRIANMLNRTIVAFCGGGWVWMTYIDRSEAIDRYPLSLFLPVLVMLLGGIAYVVSARSGHTGSDGRVGNAVERLMRSTQPYLPILKYGALGAILTMFAFWGDAERLDNAATDSYAMIVWGVASALLLDSLPGTRIANMLNRAVVVFGIAFLLVPDYLDIRTSEPYAISLIAPIALVIVGGLAYVARARPDPGR